MLPIGPNRISKMRRLYLAVKKSWLRLQLITYSKVLKARPMFAVSKNVSSRQIPGLEVFRERGVEAEARGASSRPKAIVLSLLDAEYR